MKLRTVALSGIALSVLLGGGVNAAEPKQGGTLTFINRLIGGHFNTNIASGTPTGIPGVQLHAALLRFDNNWKPQPYLAESWEISEDGLAVTVKLRKNAVFHDGKPITSEDVAFSIATTKANHPFKTMYGVVEKVDTPDKHTAVLRLSKPHPAILLAMSSQLGTVIPKHIYGKEGVNIRKNPQNSQNVVGSGPFKLKEFKPGEYIIFERFDKYFIPGRPYLDQIVYKKISESTSRVIAMEKKQADLYAWAADPIELNRLKRSKHLGMTDKGYEAVGALQWLGFNMTRKPFDDKRVRQALAYAINKEFILKAIMGGFAKRATGPVHPGSVFYSDDVNPFKFNLDKAKALLDEAGLKPDGNGIRFKTTMNVVIFSGTFKRIAEYIRSQFKKIGVDVTIKASADIRAWIKTVSNHNFDMTVDSVFNWGDPVIGIHRTYLSTNIRKGVPWHNTQQYKNPALDKLMAEAGSENDLDKRKALYAKIQKIVVEDTPIAFLVTSPYHTIWNKERVGNPPVDSIWGTQVPWDNVYIKQ